MNFPSREFSDAVSGLCFGSASDRDVSDLHASLRSDPAARDDYLWQVELHSRLARMDSGSMTLEAIVGRENPRRIGRRVALARPSGRVRWAVVAAALMVAAGGLFLALRNSREPERRLAAATTSVAASSGGGSAEGVYRETVRFAIAAAAPVIVGTGGAEPIELGAEVPYERGGDTLHIWNWSQSPKSRVMKDIRLWPHDVFAVSPDGKSLVLASGKIIDLATGEASKIDLGGEHYLDNLGGQLQRIQRLQFTPDGRNLALLLSNIVLSKSSHPLRKQDFDTMRTFQIVSYPAGELICEFPAGLKLAFSPDGKRAVTAIPENEEKQQVVEYSASTGEVLRKYEPRLREFAYVIALSGDGSRLAAYDSAGEVFIWDAATGELIHRIHLKESSPMDLRFSPDGKLLAISLIKKTTVIDVAGGVIVAAIPQEIPGLIRWSADNLGFEVISNVTGVTMTQRQDNAGNTTVYNIFPTLKHWNIEDVRKK